MILVRTPSGGWLCSDDAEAAPTHASRRARPGSTASGWALFAPRRARLGARDVAAARHVRTAPRGESGRGDTAPDERVPPACATPPGGTAFVVYLQTPELSVYVPLRSALPALRAPMLASGAASGAGTAAAAGRAPVRHARRRRDAPAALAIQAGGPDRNAIPGSGCSGFIRNGAPAVTVTHTGGPLSIYVTSGTDTTLLVADPSGRWQCSDDADDINPGVTFSTGRRGPTPSG